MNEGIGILKFLERIPGTGKRLYQFTAIDDCTRIRVLKVFDACTQRAAIHLLNDKLREWEDYYNYHRPHGALNGQTPYEGLLAKTRANVLPTS